MAGPSGILSSTLSFEPLANIAESSTARVDLCRIVGGDHDGVLVAVKRPRLDATVVPQIVDMFHDEAWVTGALQHQNVVSVVGSGKDGQGPYLATEFVRGVSLARLRRTVVRTGEVFPERVVAFVAAEVSNGLAAAHGLCSPAGEPLHFVHRDLTPENILLSFEGDVKISDFGLAKSEQRSVKTMTGMVKGTCEYMAPEQVRGRDIDGRVDLFALGVMMFELLAGKRPWQGRNPADSMTLIVEAPLPDLAELRPNLHEGLLAIVLRCLAKDPAERFQSAQELEAELQSWLRARGFPESTDHLARFVRRNSMRQMRWVERAIAGELAEPRNGGAGPAVRGAKVAGAAGDLGCAPTEAMPDLPYVSGQTDTLPQSAIKDSTARTTVSGTEDTVASFAPPSTLPDPSVSLDDTMDTEHTMPSAVVSAERLRAEAAAASEPRVASRPVFVALPRSTPPPAGGAAQPAGPRAQPSDWQTERLPDPDPPETLPEVGPVGQAMFRDAREVLAKAAALGARADVTAREAQDAAQRARLAAETSHDAGRRAERAGRAAALAQQAIAAIHAGDLEKAERLLDRVKEAQSPAPRGGSSAS